MNQSNKSRILIWIIIILVATNLSTIGSFYYHRFSEEKAAKLKAGPQVELSGEQRTRFFRNQLGLNDTQTSQFREINRTFNRTARSIEDRLDDLRKDMMDELGSQTTDSLVLKNVANEIGNKHRELKQLTIRFYLDMKKICTPEQQEKLHSIFQSMLNKENQVNLPRPGYQRGRGRNR